MTKQDLHQLKQILRENGFHKNGDLWGTTIGLLFDIAAIDLEISSIPNDWGYRPGILGNHIEDNNAFIDYTITPEQAHEYGNFLNRLNQYLKYKELDY